MATEAKRMREKIEDNKYTDFTRLEYDGKICFLTEGLYVSVVREIKKNGWEINNALPQSENQIHVVIDRVE